MKISLFFVAFLENMNFILYFYLIGYMECQRQRKEVGQTKMETLDKKQKKVRIKTSKKLVC